MGRVIGPDEGDRITDRAERLVVLKLDREQLSITTNRYGPGERGPEAHIHRRHADAFWVLDGELTFSVGPDAQPVRVGAGTGIVAPPLLVHSFLNAGARDAWFVNVHAPDAGFAESLRERRVGREPTGFDQEDPPADGGAPASNALHGPGLIESAFVRLAGTDVPAGGELATAPGLSCVYVLDGAVGVDGREAQRGALAVLENSGRVRAAGGRDARVLLIGVGA